MRNISTIAPQQIEWFWEPYLPRGVASMIFGPGGKGKSFMAVDIAARASAGLPLPGQEGRQPELKVLMLSAEDDYATVLVPRLIKQKAKMDNILVPERIFTVDKDKLKEIEATVSEFDIDLVILDPIVRWIGAKRDLNRANDTREFTGGLHEMAQRTGATFIFIHHTRKGNEGDDWEKAMGSGDFINAIRSGLYVTATNDGTRVLRHVKTNYGKEGDPITYDIDDEGFHWLSTISIDKIVRSGRRNGKPALQKAAEFISQLLATGPRSATDVEAEAKKQEIAWITLQRAKVGIAESFYSKTKGWMWRLVKD